jgi:hypothetical protein
MPEIGISTGHATSHLPPSRELDEHGVLKVDVDEAVEAINVSLKDDDVKAIDEALASRASRGWAWLEP